MILDAKITPFLRLDSQAEEAVRFYLAVFKDKFGIQETRKRKDPVDPFLASWLLNSIRLSDDSLAED